MKTKLLSLLALVVVIVMSLLFVSCGGEEEDMTAIVAQGLLGGDGASDYKLVVDNSVNSFNLSSELLPKITFEEDVTYKFSSKKDFSSELKNTFSLNEGDNLIYLRVSDSAEHTRDYTFNIYRKKLLTVTFDPNGGTMENSVIWVEEGETISEPGVARVGYTLSWTFDFSKPIIENVTIVASWTPVSYEIVADVDGVKTTYTVRYGEVPSDISAPQKEGYTFDGWKYGDRAFDADKPFDYDRSIEIVATFVPTTYIIQYVLGYEEATNSSNNPSSFDITSGTIELFAPTYDEKHTFVGWYTDGNFTEESKVTQITSDMVGNGVTLYAKWNAISLVTFDAGDGNCDTESASISYNTEYTLPTPTRENYVFDGWYNGDVRVSNTGVWTISGDVTLIAKWTPRQNTIEYVLGYADAENNSKNPVNYDVEDGEVELLAPTYDDKHIFVGWYTDPNFENSITHITADLVDQEIILYAKWNTISTVTFVTNCDTTLDPVDIAYSEAYILPSLSKDGYVFVGWFDVIGKQVYGSGNWTYDTDITLTAKWTPKELLINYVLNGGAFEGEYPKTYTIETDFGSFVIPAPTKQYAEFGGWYLDADFEQALNVSELAQYSGVTLYAKWNTIQVTINYDADGGSVSKESEVINLGEKYTLLTAEKPGYKFEGWYNGDTLVDGELVFTNSEELVINLKAKWTLMEYKIEYDLDGGGVSAELVTKYSITSSDIKLPTPTKNGYYFVGWMLDGGTTSASVVIKTGSVGDRSYKAIWTANKDENGFLYSSVDGKMVVVGLDREVGDWVLNGIKIPSTYGGAEVVAIDANAFKAFGEEFANTSYANMSSSYVTFSIPTTIKRIGANAFEGCNGIKVALYDPNQSYADYKAWDATVTWESGNMKARDCIWGFRPAIGWTRYSKVTIPDGYDTVTD